MGRFEDFVFSAVITVSLVILGGVLTAGAYGIWQESQPLCAADDRPIRCLDELRIYDGFYSGRYALAVRETDDRRLEVFTADIGTVTVRPEHVVHFNFLDQTDAE